MEDFDGSYVMIPCCNLLSFLFIFREDNSKSKLKHPNVKPKINLLGPSQSK